MAKNALGRGADTAARCKALGGGGMVGRRVVRCLRFALLGLANLLGKDRGHGLG